MSCGKAQTQDHWIGSQALYPSVTHILGINNNFPINIIYIYIYLLQTQSTHIDKTYIKSNTIIHRINDKYIIMSTYDIQP